MEKLYIKTEFVEKNLPIVLVQLGGYISQGNSEKLQKLFDKLYLNEYFNVIFDFSNVAYMSSAGWGIFVGDVKRFRDSGGDIKLIGMNSDVHEVFQMLEFYHIIDDFDDLDDALDAFGIHTKKNEQKDKPKYIEDILKESKIQPEPSTESNFYAKGTQLFDSATPPTGITDEGVKRQTHFPEKERIIRKPPVRSVKKVEKKTLPPVDITLIPVQEKIRTIAAQFPMISLRQIKKILKYEEYGREKIGYLRLYRTLKELNLETKAKRYRYYRSC